MEHPLIGYLREEALPTPFCPGCGNGMVANAFLRAVKELGYRDLSQFVFVSGIGCSSWIPSPHFKADSVHALHGRSLPVATGIKLSRPELKVVVFGGDGDLAGIGLSHLIHSARRNIELAVILVNNFNYGMTGGQLSPTTPLKAITTTTPYGNVEDPFDLVNLMKAAGASYVARWTVFHTKQLVKSIKKALTKDSFSFIEVISPCPPQFGRRSGFQSGLEMMAWLRSVTGGKGMALGEFVDVSRTGLVKRLRGG